MSMRASRERGRFSEPGHVSKRPFKLIRDPAVSCEMSEKVAVGLWLAEAIVRYDM
jgi:hypothetical protein